MFATRETGGRAAVVVGAAILILAAGRQATGQYTAGRDLDADQAVESLSIEISVGAGGKPLAEPVALDLGLGFPLWLHPLGQAEGPGRLFGAVPQETTARATIAAGGQGKFVFRREGPPGADALRATSQLLAGVRVADLARVGFLCRGDSGWVLAGYRVEVNGRLLAANDQVHASVAETQKVAAARLAEIGIQLAPLQEEADSIRMLAEAKLATDDDRTRLRKIEKLLLPLAREQDRLQRQREGSYPWFVEPAFAPPWRKGKAVQQARVTVFTAAHPGANTANFVYYRTGGHKFLFSSQANPLSAENGPASFALDLLGAPLVAADLRGHAWGMLAHPEPYGEAPDRWHPERLVVEVDGSVVFDSDAADIDRLSLKAVRVIPPAHFDTAGGLVTNTPIAREAVVWEAGKGQGLDLAGGGAAALPGAEEADFPKPEPGLAFDPAAYAAAESFAGFDPGFPPFPGEQSDGAVQELAGGGPVDIQFDEPGWTPAPSWLDVSVVFQLLDRIRDAVLEAIEADAAGEPVQVEHVRVQRLAADGFRVAWDVHGDEANVAGYLVELHVLRPHAASPLGAGVWSTVVGPGVYQADAADVLPALEAEAGGDRLLAYVVASVAPQAAGGSNPGQLSPAIPLVAGERLSPAGGFQYEDASGTVGAAPFSIGEPASRRAVWFPGPAASHTGFVFDTGGVGQNIVLRPETGDAWLAQTLQPDARVEGTYRLVGHLGFLGTSVTAANAATADVSLNLLGDGRPPLGPATCSGTMGERLMPFSLDLDTSGSGPGSWPARVRVLVRGGDADFAHPPVLIGLRLVRP